MPKNQWKLLLLYYFFIKDSTATRCWFIKLFSSGLPASGATFCASEQSLGLQHSIEHCLLISKYDLYF